MDNNIDAKKILFVLPLEGWKRPPGRPHTTWLKTVQNDLISHNLTLTKAVDMTMAGLLL